MTEQNQATPDSNPPNDASANSIAGTVTPANAAADRIMSRIIGNLLRIGVLLSSLLVVSGGVLYLIRHGQQHPQYRQFVPGDASASDLGAIWKDILGGHGRAIIRLGLLVLMATPILRIAISVAGYIVEKDRLYTILTLVVLTIVLSGIFGLI